MQFQYSVGVSFLNKSHLKLLLAEKVRQNHVNVCAYAPSSSRW